MDKKIISKADEQLRSLIRAIGFRCREDILSCVWDDDMVRALKNSPLLPEHSYCIMSAATKRQRSRVESFSKSFPDSGFAQAVPILSEWSFREICNFSIVPAAQPDLIVLISSAGEKSQPVQRDWLVVSNTRTLRSRVQRLGNFYWSGRDSDLSLFRKHWGL